MTIRKIRQSCGLTTITEQNPDRWAPWPLRRHCRWKCSRGHFRQLFKSPPKSGNAVALR